MRSEVTIPSNGEQLAAYLYRPEADGDVPCVVMAHGFSATRDDGLPAYAEAFVEAGMAVVLFDYRHFGASSGEPRQLLDIGKQQDDYRAAIAYARKLDGVDPARVALFGSSFSGGHVVAVAAGDPQIAAVVSQCPFADGIAVLRKVPPKNALIATARGIADQAAAIARRPPVMMPAVGAPGTFAVMTAPEAEPGFAAIVDEGSLWRNSVTARVMLTVATYRPVTKAASLAMPLLICVCDGDATTPPEGAVKMAERAPRGEVKHYPYGHFEIYHDPQARADQVEFLTRQLVPGAAIPA
jgi:pimeloyl-ACP methyl ester carboxylesterase